MILRLIESTAELGKLFANRHRHRHTLLKRLAFLPAKLLQKLIQNLFGIIDVQFLSYHLDNVLGHDA